MAADNESEMTDLQSWLNANQLDLVLARERDGLGSIENDEQRARREQAIEQMATYSSMLRNTATTSVSLTASYGANGRLRRRPFSFKLEFEDGRWNVDEKELGATPRLGDVVTFDDGRPWRVRATQSVRTRPTQKPVHELFVCAPAA